MTKADITEEIVNENLQNDVVSELTPTNEEEKATDKNDANSYENSDSEIDYDALIKEDLAALRSEFAELSDLSDITELENPLRYAELRDLGLSAAEAYLATKRRRVDNRSHLRSIHSIKSTHQNIMSDSEITAARELFGDMSDSEIRKLYKRVTK